MPEIAYALASWACKSVGAKLAARIPAPALNIKLRREIMSVLSLSVIKKLRKCETSVPKSARPVNDPSATRFLRVVEGQGIARAVSTAVNLSISRGLLEKV